MRSSRPPAAGFRVKTWNGDEGTAAAVARAHAPGNGDLKKRIAARMLSGTGIGRLLASVLPPRGVLVLNYHRVGDGTASPYDRELWSATEAAFDAQVGFLARNADVIAAADIDRALRDGKGRYVAITFDDGYLDNYALAYPVLRRHGVPATFFIATGFIDRPSLPWWDEIAWLLRHARGDSIPLAPWFQAPLSLHPHHGGAIRQVLTRYKALPCDDAARMLEALREACGVRHPDAVPGHWMDWDMIREMACNGMTIGGHTVHHPVLSRMPRERQREEIEGCGARILAETGRPMEYFAYPVGAPWAFDADTRRCLEGAGVRRAFSYYGGFATQRSEPLDTPRVAIEDRTGLNEFKAMTRLPQVFCRRPYA